MSLGREGKRGSEGIGGRETGLPVQLVKGFVILMM